MKRCVLAHKRVPTALRVGSRGAAGVLAVLFLPVLVAALAGTLSLGRASVLRCRMSQAADLAALAAVQCLDRDRLGEGEIVLVKTQARAVAEEYAFANLTAGQWQPIDLSVDTYCCNAGENGADPITGRRYEYTTVRVRITCTEWIAIGPMRLCVTLSGQAAASAVPR